MKGIFPAETYGIFLRKTATRLESLGKNPPGEILIVEIRSAAERDGEFV